MRNRVRPGRKKLVMERRQGLYQIQPYLLAFALQIGLPELAPPCKAVYTMNEAGLFHLASEILLERLAVNKGPFFSSISCEALPAQQ